MERGKDLGKVLDKESLGDESRPDGGFLNHGIPSNSFFSEAGMARPHYFEIKKCAISPSRIA